MSDTIICPNCNQKIDISQALQQESEKKIKQELLKIQQQADVKNKELLAKEAQLQQQQNTIKEQVEKLTEEAKDQLKRQLWEQAQLKAKEKVGGELQDLQKQLQEQKQLQVEAEKKEIELRQKQRQLEDDKRQFELTLTRKMDEERQILSEKIEKQVQEKMNFKILEKEKQLADTQKALEEAQRKANQGSQQNQGEVFELDLEEKLKNTFIHDEISPVAKGIQGADIVHYVCDNQGRRAGTILWEIKQTKHWTEKWVGKLKDDLRAQKANIPIIITLNLPREVESFGYYQGVWVSQPEYALQLATALRHHLINVAFEKTAALGKGEKQEILYNYIASHEFRQRVESFVEVFQDIQQQTQKERLAFEKIWKQREMQVQRLMMNTAGMYGEIQGLVGSSMPEIKGLELQALDKPRSDGKQEERLF